MNEAFSITREIDAFAKYLAEEEKSGVTIAKYVRDVQCFLRWLGGQGVSGGVIFRTRSGRPLDRSNIWAAMKRLCARAKVDPGKVFPHNLRKLFARTFYDLEKDIAKLADVLGHSSINTTRIYIMSTGQEHRRQLERLRLLA